ncbi:hypothetical protein Dsin_012066 [Dipteronia sinensis]|uniref:Tf2-1-like SH3-like domain-containing protein n=1 Tax=Dipteronia sinensis TaxID=43782 RepID=A0AAE0AHD7_9ROSI|nr:hypothetical protein Dsin_012066 [Dipteronia sinensis]
MAVPYLLCLFRQAHQKLASRFFEPYQIVARIDAVAYKLALPDMAWIHPMFHESLLKKKIVDTSRINPDLPPFSEDNTPIFHLLCIRDYRWIKKWGKYVTEALVQWKSLPIEDATWEDVDHLGLQFPDIDLEDKDHVQRRADDRNHQHRIRKPNPKYRG